MTIALGAPRILGFKRRSGPELFASLCDEIDKAADALQTFIGDATDATGED